MHGPSFEWYITKRSQNRSLQPSESHTMEESISKPKRREWHKVRLGGVGARKNDIEDTSLLEKKDNMHLSRTALPARGFNTDKAGCHPRAHFIFSPLPF